MDKKSLENRIGFIFSEELFADIPFEAGFSPKDKLYDKNQFYVNWGRSIICAAYAFHSYSDNQSWSINELNQKVKSSLQFIENDIYKSYKLKEFIIKNNNAPGNSYPEISSKLIVLIYLQHGFKGVTTFIMPVFQKLKSSRKLSPEEIIEKYAKSRNQKLSYSTSYLSGRLDAKIYKCRISIGSQYAEGRGLGINKAQEEAENSFYQKYKNNIEQLLYNLQPNRKNRTITEDRKKQLVDVAKLLRIQGKYISFDQMDEVLTHPSYRNIQQDRSSIDNSLLAALGNMLLDLLTYDYCYQHLITSVEKHQKLLRKNCIADSLSDNYLMYLLRGPNKAINNSNDEMKAEVFQGILASYWINYLTKNDEEILECARKYAVTRLEISNLLTDADYLDFLEKTANQLEWKVAKTTIFAGQDAQAKLLFTSTITVTGIYWEQSGTGTAKRENEAISLAAQDVLVKIPRYCDDPDIAASIQNKLSKYKIPDLIPPKPTPKQPISGPKPVPKIPVPSKTLEEVFFDRSENILYICKGTFSCERKHHKIISATGVLTSLEGTPVKIDVQYCTSCKIYFINQDTYIDYREKYGNLMGNFAFHDRSGSNVQGSGDWADKSILKLCGYNVDKKIGLNDVKRRYILKNIMIRDILPKHRIEEYLEFFIRMNKDDRDKIMAVRKWKSDLDWVRRFNLDQQKQVWIKEIKKYRNS